MPRPVGYGRPGTKVIPDGWQEAAAGVVENTLDCTVTVGPSGTVSAWSDTAGKTQTTPAAAVYTGPAAVTPVVEDTVQPVDAEDVLPLRSYEITLKRAAAVQVGHVVAISASPDPMLVGRRLKVTGVEKASRRFSRILRATDTN